MDWSSYIPVIAVNYVVAREPLISGVREPEAKIKARPEKNWKPKLEKRLFVYMIRFQL